MVDGERLRRGIQCGVCLRVRTLNVCLTVAFLRPTLVNIDSVRWSTIPILLYRLLLIVTLLSLSNLMSIILNSANSFTVFFFVQSLRVDVQICVFFSNNQRP